MDMDTFFLSGDVLDCNVSSSKRGDVSSRINYVLRDCNTSCRQIYVLPAIRCRIPTLIVRRCHIWCYWIPTHNTSRPNICVIKQWRDVIPLPHNTRLHCLIVKQCHPILHAIYGVRYRDTSLHIITRHGGGENVAHWRYLVYVCGMSTMAEWYWKICKRYLRISQTTAQICLYCFVSLWHCLQREKALDWW